MNAVLLHESGGDLTQALLAEEGTKMDAKPVLMSLHINRAALASGEREKFVEELIGGFVEGDAATRRIAAPDFAFEFEEPVLGEVFRVRETLLLGAHAVVTSVDERRALPEARVLALIDVELSAHEFMRGRHTRTHTRFLDECLHLCKGCVTFCY